MMTPFFGANYASLSSAKVRQKGVLMAAEVSMG